MTGVTPHEGGYPVKIVRDRTADRLSPSGEPGELFYRADVPLEERAKPLRQKLAEEVAEYLLDPGDGELADVVAVVQGLARVHALSWRELVQLAEEDPRGGFLEGVMMYVLHPEFDRPKGDA